MRSLDAIVMNPAARKITGGNPTIRREILYTLADLKTTQNHSLLKTANIIDRALRAQGAQIQNTVQRYLQQQAKMPIRESRLGSQMIQIRGGLIREEKHTIHTGKEQGKMTEVIENKSENQIPSMTWWIREQVMKPTEREPSPQRKSIYSAQPEELRTEEEETNRKTFQYERLRNWMDVGMRVLIAAGWQSNCVYEECLFPPKQTYCGINWEQITIDGQQQESSENNSTSKYPTMSKDNERTIELHVIVAIISKIAYALIAIKVGGQEQFVATVIVGKH